MENRKHVPLTEAQVQAAIDGKLKLVTRDGQKVLGLGRKEAIALACNKLVAAFEGGARATYYKTGNYADSGVHYLDLFIDETELNVFDIENYVPKGDIKGFPLEVVKWMLREQVAQGCKEDVTVFEENRRYNCAKGGFEWSRSESFTHNVCEAIIRYKIFDIFFQKYPKASAETSGTVTGAKAERRVITDSGGGRVIVGAAPSENFLLASLRADTAKMLSIAAAKNSDYGGSESNPFANITICEHTSKVPAERGVMVRMTDKFSRISTLLDKEAQVEGETIEDTLIDFANYCLILKALIQYKKRNGPSVH